MPHLNSVLAPPFSKTLNAISEYFNDFSELRTPGEIVSEQALKYCDLNLGLLKSNHHVRSPRSLPPLRMDCTGSVPPFHLHWSDGMRLTCPFW